MYFQQGSSSLNYTFAPTVYFCFPQNYHQQYFLACNLAHIFFPSWKQNHTFMFQFITEDAQMFSCEYPCNSHKENNLDGNDALGMKNGAALDLSWVFSSHNSGGITGRSSSLQMEQYYSCSLQNGKAFNPVLRYQLSPVLFPFCPITLR